MARARSPATRTLLVELGTEELPPRALQDLSQAFATALCAALVHARVLVEAAGGVRCFATPRRLAVAVEAVAARQPSSRQLRRGPALAAAYTASGAPTPALRGFARACGVSPAALRAQKTAKGTWMVYEQKLPGEKLDVVISRCLQEAIGKLPIAKRMRWGEQTIEFVRPVHWLVVLHGTKRLPSSVLGLKATRCTYGHRFHAPARLKLPSADEYAATLEQSGKVVADFAARRARIDKQIQWLARRAQAKAVVDAQLLELVTGLVEWPQAVLGKFEPRFLQMPAEVLVSCMREHQKYFHLLDAQERLLPMFITVSNIKSKSPRRLCAGNERVLRARLADAEFFWNADRRVGLSAYAARLDGLLFHQKLGTLQDKVERLGALAQTIAGAVGAPPDEVARAAELCKADLVSEMVGEFAELQGVAGRYYALEQGESAAVAAAIEQHYYPRFAGDQLPQSDVARCLALADRIDSLAGIFATGQLPSGDKDPYALRRAALGVVRILIEARWEVDLQQLCARALAAFDTPKYAPHNLATDVVETLFDYVMQRLKVWYQEQPGVASETLNAVLACRPHSPLDFAARLHAVSAFVAARQSAAQALATANKRIANILTKSAAQPQTPYAPQLGEAPAEIALAKAVKRCQQQLEPQLAARAYQDALETLATLREPVDQFFADVRVLHEQAAIRQNRLALLAAIRVLFLKVADISKLSVISDQ